MKWGCNMAVEGYQFEKGKAYYANPTLQGAKQMIVACTGVTRGRDGLYATFTRVGLLKRVKVSEIEGRDTVMLKCADGDYFVSSAIEVDLDNVANVLEALG